MMTGLKPHIIELSKWLLILLGLAALQKLITPSATLIGQDMSSIEGGILNEYFTVVLAEVFKVFAYIWLITSPIVLLRRAAINRGKEKGATSTPSTPSKSKKKIDLYLALSFIVFLVASIIHYPALYEELLPSFGLAILFKLAQWVSPFWLNFVAAALLIYGLFQDVLTVSAIKKLPNRWKNTDRKQKATVTAALLLFVLIIVAPQLTNFSFSPVNSKRPNVVFIGVDSLRTDVVKNSYITPNLSKMLDDPYSVFFKDHQIGIPRTFPSWVETLQGQYGAKTGIRHMFPSLNELRKPREGLAKQLSSAGYRTAVFSDFAGDIFPRFDSGFELVDAPNMNLASLISQNIDKSFPLFLPFILTKPGRSVFPEIRDLPSFADPFALAESANSFIAKQSKQSFFLTIFFSTAHFPYASPWPFYQKFAEANYPGPFYFQKNPELAHNSNDLSQKSQEQVRNLYKGAISSIDHAISTLVQTLKEKNLWDNTLIVITADHGEDLFENGLTQGHGEQLLGTNVLTVPLLIKIPKAEGNPKHPAVSKLSRSIDLAPTILDFVGETAKQMDGVSLRPLMNGLNTSIPINTSYSETGIWFSNKGNARFQKERLFYPGISQLLSFDPGNTREIILNEKYENVIITAKHRSFIVGDYKLTYSPTKDGVIYRLFNRKQDKQNLRDLAKEKPQLLNTMMEQFKKKVAEIEPNIKIIDDYLVPL